MLRLYTVGKSKSVASAAASLALPSLGTGHVLLFLLGPAVVSLSIAMYERRQLMRQNLAEVGTALAVSTTDGLFGTALVVKWLSIALPYLRLCLSLLSHSCRATLRHPWP
jgi:putative effector of murein hydrolase